MLTQAAGGRSTCFSGGAIRIAGREPRLAEHRDVWRESNVMFRDAVSCRGFESLEHFGQECRQILPGIIELGSWRQSIIDTLSGAADWPARSRFLWTLEQKENLLFGITARFVASIGD
jgi:hypothetical protein